ncbi:hypothetical protein AB0F81_33405 [Actinoplanes sp. NPDC024001]|uniref:hypothetical protein n=1 Tax=Actinoplanes sp. NPDC024001 TaxID=3154598 RepID=UPI0033D48789
MEKTITDLKESLQREGFDRKAILSGEQMRTAQELLDGSDGALDTPPEELRYIEGLLNLPLGHLKQFRIIPAPGYEQCRCGRTPSALDITATAARNHIHGKEMMRDTLIGFANLFEMAQDGRMAECFGCGRPMLSSSYWTSGYMYA